VKVNEQPAPFFSLLVSGKGMKGEGEGGGCPKLNHTCTRARESLFKCDDEFSKLLSLLPRRPK